MSKHGDFSGPYFPVFEVNTGEYGPEKITYLDNFHTGSSAYFPKCVKRIRKASKEDNC